MNKNQLYKRFKLDPKTAKSGDLMKAMNQRKSQGKGMPIMHKKHKKIGDQPSMANWSPVPKQSKGLSNNSTFSGTSSPILGNVKNNLAKSQKKHKTHKKGEPFAPMNKPGVPSIKELNDGGSNNKGLEKQAQNFTKAKKMNSEMMCKSCMKSHPKGKHMMKKGMKMVPPSKGHKPNGAHGRAAVKQLGRTKTTGNFARIEASKGKGAAIAAFQNARRAHMK